MGQVIRKTKDGRFIGWYIRWREAGRRICIASKQPSAAEARKMLVQIEARVIQGKPGLETDEDFATEASDEPLTVAGLCERFLATSHPRAKCPKEYRRKAIEDFKYILPLVGHIELDKLKRRDLEGALDKLSRRYKPNTIRGALRPLAAALTWAVRQELITQSPASRLVLPKLEHSTEHLSDENARKLLAEAERQARTARGPVRKLERYSFFVGVSLAVRLGLRRGEVYGLRWQDLDLEKRRLTVARSYEGSTKNGKPRTLPISDELHTILAEWRKLCPIEQTHICGYAVRTRVGLAQLLREAGCPPLQRGWHALRHTFATIWVEQGGSIMTLKEMLGHSSLNMVLIYSHVSPRALAADMAKIKL